MKPKGVFWDAWWPQWRSHWRVLHAWPVSAQVVLLSGVTLLMSLWLSWQISGEAWLTWWQATDREAQAAQQLQALQQQVDQHQARVASLQAMLHPSGKDWPAWLSLPASTGVRTLGAEPQSPQWQGSLATLLTAWQNHAQAMPHARVTGFVLSPGTSPQRFTLQLQTREDAAQVLAHSKDVQPLVLAASQDTKALRLYNPFDASGLSQGLPPPLMPRPVGPTPLPDIELSQWQWQGALSGPGHTRAVLSHQGMMYSVLPGQALGKDGGEVVHINPDHLLLREWALDAQGQWQSRDVRWPAKGMP
jgi:hypothetical protein